MSNLADILKNSKIKVRQYDRYQFGDRDKMKELFIEAFGLVDKTFGKYEHLPEYEEIIDWLCDTKGKGLFLTGSYGRGKSTILTGVIPLLFQAIYNKILTPTFARDLHKEKSLSWAILIDDIGQEEVINDYGTKIDAVEYAISHCEDQNKLLIMTANLTKQQIIERYGGRINDRIHRLCKVIIFTGQSFRK